MLTDLACVIESMRRGEVVRIVNDIAAEQPESSRGVRHVVLAAERACTRSLNQLLASGDGYPVFTTTRDRLEQLRMVGAQFVDEENCEIRQSGKKRGEPVDPSILTDRLSAAAAILTSGDAKLAADALDGFKVRCTDWGGVANCQRVFEAAVDLTRLAGLIPAAILCRQSGNQTAAAERPAGTGGASPPTVSIRQVVDHRRAHLTSTLVRQGPRVRLPTRHGNFLLQGYEDSLSGQLHLALWTGPLRDPALVRVHSECLTGDLLGSLRCDCGPQLDRALARLVQEGSGILLYLRQEGRGIGLGNKLRTYAIQDRGFDTIEANEQIGFEADLRDYSLAAEMLVDLGISSIRLLTNNPEKVSGLKKHGIRVAARVPLVVEPCSENSAYLDVKQKKMGHWLS